ncbi:hypothetical protein EWI07_00755 [Sporolactobacillus sp. THM7-4]|nr:hypothetical protein EWI07_00755 [Sporolactobacillus sp. THM7-4]
MNEDLLILSALGSVVVGKLFIAWGLTPQKNRTGADGNLIFYGSVMQVNGNALDAGFLRGETPDKIGTQLQVMAYIMSVYSFIVIQDQYARIKIGLAVNLILVLSEIIILSDRSIWNKNYLVIGNMIYAIGSLIHAMGKKNRLYSPSPLTTIDPLETKGAWVQAIGIIIIFSGTAAESTIDSGNKQK